MNRNLLLLTVMVFALSSTLLAQTTITPFNGTNFEGWKFKGDAEHCWEVGLLQADATTFTVTPVPVAAEQRNPGARQRGRIPAMVNIVGAVRAQRDLPARRGVDIYTEEKFGDCTVKLEFLITRGSNSGVYLMGEYEVQIADSFAKALDARIGQGDMGAIYSAAAPSRNAAGVPGTWQTFEIEFVAPKFDEAGEKTANAIFKRVVLNGVLVQENVEVQGSTGGGLTGRESATGPLMFQGDHGPVAFRNIEIIVP